MRRPYASGLLAVATLIGPPQQAAARLDKATKHVHVPSFASLWRVSGWMSFTGANRKVRQRLVNFDVHFHC